MQMNEKFSFQKAWEILFPYLLYYLSYNAAYLILAFLYQVSVKSIGGAYGAFMTANEATVSGAVGGLCSLIGILPLLPMLKRELFWRAELLSGAEGETEAVEKEKILFGEDKQDGKAAGRNQIAGLTVTVILALSVSLGLNALLALTGFVESSQTYRQVADHQYGVVFGIGLLLYGMISPLAEEILFRGVIYNRLRRHFGPLVGIAASALFFGIFHGNLVQGVYGTVMGIFIAYMYERSGKFFTPVLFHAVANLAVYTAAYLQGVQEILFTPAGCMGLLAVAAGSVWLERRKSKLI